MAHTDAVAGAVLGTAVGDALGLPYEGLSPRRGAAMLGAADRYRFLPGHGMVSDDTEHTCMVARALAVAGTDAPGFRRSLAWGLRWWFLGLPAGIGLATLRACVKLWLGLHHSGVHSAGNGPAMRSAPIGAAVDDDAALFDLVRASTQLTHTDPRALHGALAVALAARAARRGELTATVVTDALLALAGDAASETSDLLIRAGESAVRGESTREFAASLGLERGVTGFVMHSVPCALHAAFAHPRDLRNALIAIIAAGGDADTTAAMTGGVVGAGVGEAGIPAELLETLAEWPRTVGWMRRLAHAAARGAAGEPQTPPRLAAPLVLLRNAGFMVVVLLHGFRRLLPPY